MVYMLVIKFSIRAVKVDFIASLYNKGALNINYHKADKETTRMWVCVPAGFRINYQLTAGNEEITPRL